MSTQVGFLDSLIAANGSPIGIVCSGFFAMPYGNGQTGLILGDSAGNLWLLQIATDGSLTTAQVTL